MISKGYFLIALPFWESIPGPLQWDWLQWKGCDLHILPGDTELNGPWMNRRELSAEDLLTFPESSLHMWLSFRLKTKMHPNNKKNHMTLCD